MTRPGRMVRGAAIFGAVLQAAVAMFQLLLAAGLPFGAAAWGGRHRVLPTNLRIGSAAAAAVLMSGAWIILARANVARPGPGSRFIRGTCWVFAGYLAFNTLANAASTSMMERVILTPVTVILTVCFVVVAWSRIAR